MLAMMWNEAKHDLERKQQEQKEAELEESGRRNRNVSVLSKEPRASTSTVSMGEVVLQRHTPVTYKYNIDLKSLFFCNDSRPNSVSTTAFLLCTAP